MKNPVIIKTHDNPKDQNVRSGPGRVKNTPRCGSAAEVASEVHVYFIKNIDPLVKTGR